MLENPEDFLDPTLNLDFKLILLLVIQLCISCNCVFMEMTAREGVAPLQISMVSSTIWVDAQLYHSNSFFNQDSTEVETPRLLITNQIHKLKSAH